MKPAKIVAASILVAVVAIGAPASALFGPMPVTDVTAEPIWIKTLAQDVLAAESLKNILKSELSNLLPTASTWAADTKNPQALMVPIFVEGATVLAGYQAQLAANTGAPVQPNHALEMAQTGMAQIPTDAADLADARVASDECTGNVCVQQVGHRFQQIAATNAIEQRQFEYTAYQEKVTGETAAAAWMTTPWKPGGN